MTASTAASQRKYRNPGPGPLASHEVQILGLVAEGHTNAAIGRALHISEAMIRVHLHRIESKLGAHGRAHAVAIGYNRGLLRVPGCYCRMGAR